MINSALYFPVGPGAIVDGPVDFLVILRAFPFVPGSKIDSAYFLTSEKYA